MTGPYDAYKFTCTAATSVGWSSIPGPYPICPSWKGSENFYCLPDGECRPDLCDCDAGRLFCEKGINLCQPDIYETLPISKVDPNAEFKCDDRTDGVYWSSVPGPYPVCLWFGEGDQSCIPDEQACKPSRMGISPRYCDCDAGRKLCDEGINMCHVDCPAYIHGRDSIEPGGRPRAMGGCVDGKAEGGGYGALGTSREYDALSCCSSEALYLINTHQSLPGGFSFDASNSSPDSQCGLYSAAMASAICNPNIGRFVINNTLTVCQLACEELFEACGLPGENLPQFANYTDAVGLCTEAWGGFDSLLSDSPCEDDPNGFACLSGIHRVEVVEGSFNVDCLAFAWPTQNEIDHDRDENVPLDNVCSGRSGSKVRGRGSGVKIPRGIFYILFAPLVTIYYLVKLCCCKKEKEQEEDQKATASGAGAAPSSAAHTPVVTAMPTASATAASDSPVASAPPAPFVPTVYVPTAAAGASVPGSGTPQGCTTVFVPAAGGLSIPGQGKPASDGSSADTENKTQKDSDDPNLTFDQRMDLRFLEGKLQMEMITPQEFEEKKKEILSS